MGKFAPTPGAIRERPSPPLGELSRVVITSAVRTIEGDGVAPGTEGVIVHVWGRGEAYEVEFAEALGPATVEAEDLQPIA